MTRTDLQAPVNSARPTRWRLGRLLPLLLLAAAVGLILPGCDTVESLERDASVYLAKGDRISAAIQYRALLARDPGHVEAHFQLGKILAAASILPAAEDSLRRAMELGKPAVEVVPVLGPVLLDLDKYKELLELLAPDPKRPQSRDPKMLAEHAVLRGLAYLGQRDHTSANTQFQLAMSASPDKAKLGLARLALAKNDRKRAEELIGEVLASNPRNAEAHLALAELRRTFGELDKALPEYAEAARLEPNNVTTAILQGIALVSADRIKDAQPVLERARKLAPAGPLLYFALGLIECKEKRYRPCGEYLQKVFDVLPQYLPAILLAGQLNYATGNFEQGQDAFARYLARFPGDPHARKMLAATLLAKLQAQAALNVLRPLLAARTEDPQLLALAGQAMLQLGHLREAREALVKAVKLAPGDPELRSALAMTHLAGGLRRRAEADFRAAVALKPANTKADYGLIMMLLGENRIEHAREAVAAVEQRLPTDPETHMLKGVVLRAAGDARSARQAFQRAAQLGPNFFAAVQELADLDVEEGKVDDARKRIQDVLKKDATHLDALLAMALIDLRAGRRPEGIAWARQAADAHPDSPQALLLVADALADSGELNDAINAVQQALKARPRHPGALRTLGQLQMRMKDYAAATTTFNTLAGVQPGSTEAALLLASAYLAAGDFRTALASARGALKRNPGSTEAMALVGDTLLQGKKYSEALEFALKLQRERPKLAYGFRLEGQTLLAQGDARRAVKALEAAAKLEPGGPALIMMHHATSVASPGSEREAPLEDWIRKNPDENETRMYLADALGAKGRYKDAIAHYEELVRRDPKDPRALNNLAWVLLAVNDSRAVEYAERAFQLSPNVAPVLDTYGWALVTRGKLHEGIQMLLKAVALDGKNPEIRYHLAKGLAQVGDKTRARAELKAILSAGTPFPQADEARALLASLGP